MIGAIIGSTMPSSQKALGILKFFSVTNTILAAIISLIEIQPSTGIVGKYFVTFTGDVGAEEESVEAGAKTEESSGAMVEKVAIAHPEMELYRSLF